MNFQKPWKDKLSYHLANKRIIYFILILCIISLVLVYTRHNYKNRKLLLIRCDDIGISSSVNNAMLKLIEKQMPISASIIFNASKANEAVKILKRHPEVSVGIHLTLNSEWKENKWGPILNIDSVSSLVDSNGYFFPGRTSFFRNKPKLDEIKSELAAQIQKGLSSGLKIDYVDYHMFTAISTFELQELTRSLAQKFNLAMSNFYGERETNELYLAQINNKENTLIELLNSINKGEILLLISHIDFNPYQQMHDLNRTDFNSTSAARISEFKALISSEFMKKIKKNNIKLITYKDLIKFYGIKN